MARTKLRKYVLDSNCFVEASREPRAQTAFDTFCAHASPGLHLSSVVAAELRAGAGRNRSTLERVVFAPYVRRGRVVTPSSKSWDALGDTLAALVQREGLVIAQVRRSFVFDILVAHSCRELGAVLISSNTRDLERIEQIFAFDFTSPYPKLS